MKRKVTIILATVILATVLVLLETTVAAHAAPHRDTVVLLDDVTINGSLTLNDGTWRAPAFPDTLALTGDFADNGGTFDANGGTMRFAGTTTLTGSTSTIFASVTIASGATLVAHPAAMACRGDWNCQGTFNPNGGEVFFDASGPQVFSGACHFHDVTVRSGRTLMLDTAADFGYDRILTVNGSFDTLTLAPTQMACPRQ